MNSILNLVIGMAFSGAGAVGIYSLLIYMNYKEWWWKDYERN